MFFGSTLLLLVLMLMVIGSMFFLSEEFAISQIEMRFKSDFDNISQVLQSRDVQEKILEYSNTHAIDIVVVQDDFSLTASSYKKSIVNNRYFSANIMNAKNTGYHITIHQKSLNDLYVSISQKARIDDGSYIVNIRYQLYRYGYFKRKLILLGLLIVLITACITYLMVNRILSSYKSDVKKLIYHVQKASSSQSYYEKIIIDETNGEEIIRVSKEFNSLIDSYNHLLDSSHKSNSRFSSFLTTIPIGIIIFSNDGRLEIINNTALTFLKVESTKELFYTSQDFRINHPALQDIAKKVITDKHIRKFEIRLNDDRDVFVEVRPIYNKYNADRCEGVLLVLLDITKTKQTLAVKDEFVSNVSHEIKTPLTVIKGLIEVISDARDEFSEDEKEMSLRILGEETDRLDLLFSELLTLSRIDTDLKESGIQHIDPHHLLAAEIERGRIRSAGKSILILEKGNDLQQIHIIGKEIHFLQIIRNILDNAIKYSPEASTITVTQHISGSEYTISIQDEGMGIPSSEIPRIFDRFYRVEKSRNSTIQGSGLGLSIAEGFVTAMSGKIEVSSESGKGSMFTIRFPIAVKTQ